jgi:Arc/MetJ-type ribon-helix-helix transcriptional regulator
MTQLVTRIDDKLTALVDELVAEGVADSRSDAVRQGLRALADLHRRRRTAQAIVDSYRSRPQTADEVGWADAATVRMIAEESW